MLDKDAKFTLGFITRQQIAAELNVAIDRVEFAVDDDRLTDDICCAYASEIGSDPDMEEMITEDTVRSVLGIDDEQDFDLEVV